MASFKAIDVFIFCGVQWKSVLFWFFWGSDRHFNPPTPTHSLPSGSATVTRVVEEVRSGRKSDRPEEFIRIPHAAPAPSRAVVYMAPVE